MVGEGGFATGILMRVDRGLTYVDLEASGERGAVVGKSVSRRLADATRCAGDQSHAVFKPVNDRSLTGAYEVPTNHFDNDVTTGCLFTHRS
jgi:hypothetical protein